jgi:replicative DNA helicase
VLGCILLDPTRALSDCAEAGISGAWFYDMRHRIIFDAMARLDRQSCGVDVLLVRNALRDSGDLDKIGGDAYLGNLPDCVPSSANLVHYLNILEELHMARVLVRTCADAVGSVFGDGSAGIDVILAEAEKQILALAETRSGSCEQGVKALLGPVIDKLEDKYHRGSAQMVGISTGLEYFDKVTCGLGGENGNMVVIAGRPGTGKTSWAIDMALHAAIDCPWFTPKLDSQGKQIKEDDKLQWDQHRGLPVGIFSLEMSASSLVHKMLFQRARADLQRWRTGFALESDHPKLVKAAGEIAAAKIWIDDTGRCSIGELRAKARRWVRQYGIRLFVVDYIQLMRTDGRRFRDDRVQELAEISGELQNLGKQLGVPFLVLAQMNRDYEKEPNRAPRLSDLKDCGAIEQDADLVGFLYPPSKEDAEAKQKYVEAMEAVHGQDWSKYPRRINLIIAKNRFGPTGIAELLFEHHCTHFLDYGRWLKDHGHRAAAMGERKRAGGAMPTTEEMGL